MAFVHFVYMHIDMLHIDIKLVHDVYMYIDLLHVDMILAHRKCMYTVSNPMQTLIIDASWPDLSKVVIG